MASRIDRTAAPEPSAEVDGETRPVPVIDPTRPPPLARLDAAIAEARDGSERWGALSAFDRAALLDEVHEATAAAADDWVSAACAAKRIDAESPLVGEEWMSGPYAVLSATTVLAGSLRALADGRSPIAGDRIRRAPGGRSRVQLLPRSTRERILFNGFSAEAWSLPGVDAEQWRAAAGLGAERSGSGGVGLVLGAGNITSIAPLDVLWELVACRRAVLLKLNPILGGMRAVLERALAPLIREGLVRIAEGGADVGEYLTAHPGIDHVHITGSAATHDAIVWGVGEDAARRRAAGEPRLRVPITSELGGVSPVIVVPGHWSKAELRFQAEHVVTMRLHNAGHNCIAAQVLLLSADWPQRAEFVAELRRVLAGLPRRSPWYPSAAARIEAAAERPGAERLGDCVLLGASGASGASDGATAEWVNRTECFAGVLAIEELPGVGAEFLDAAVAFANDQLAGTLGANVLIDPPTLRGIGADRFDESLTALRYGTIAVNAWTAVGFLTATAPWGAFPGGELTDVGSGIGVVHNALLLDAVERTVVRGPFRPFPRSVLGGELSLFPKPPWFVTARSAAVTGRRLSAYAARPGGVRLPAIFAAAFRA